MSQPPLPFLASLEIIVGRYSLTSRFGKSVAINAAFGGAGSFAILEGAGACAGVEKNVEEFELTIVEAAQRPGSATLTLQPHIENISIPIQRTSTNLNFMLLCGVSNGDEESGGEIVEQEGKVSGSCGVTSDSAIVNGWRHSLYTLRAPTRPLNGDGVLVVARVADECGIRFASGLT